MEMEMSRSDMLECFKLLLIVGKRQSEWDYGTPFRGLAVWEQAGKMVWSVCDSEMILDVTLPVEIDGGTAFQIVDFPRVSRYIQTLSDGAMVEWKMTDDKCLIKEVGRRGGVRLPVLDYSLIEQPEWGEVTEWELGELSTQGKTASNFCGRDEGKPSFRGVCISEGSVIGTDGFWLGRLVFSSGGFAALQDVLLPPKVFDVLSFGTEGVVQCSSSKGSVRFEKGNVRLCSRLIDADFPVQGVRTVEEQCLSTEKFSWEVDGEAMAKALARVKLFAVPEKWNALAGACCLRVEDGVLIVASAKETDGMVEEFLDVNVTGESTKIWVNASRLAWFVDYVVALGEKLVLHCSGTALWMSYGGNFFMLAQIRGEE